MQVSGLESPVHKAAPLSKTPLPRRRETGSALVLSVVLNQRGPAVLSTRTPQCRLAQKRALISFASFPEFILVKKKNFLNVASFCYFRGIKSKSMTRFTVYIAHALSTILSCLHNFFSSGKPEAPYLWRLGGQGQP